MNHLHILRAFAVLVLLLGLPGLVSAAVCSGTAGPFYGQTKYASSLTPIGTVILEYPAQNVSVRCSGYGKAREIFIFVQTGRAMEPGTPLDNGLFDGFRYNGRIYRSGDVIPTGVMTDSAQSVTGQLAYLISKSGPFWGSGGTFPYRVRMRIGPANPDGTPATGSFEIGADAGVGFTYDGTCKVRTGDAHQTVSLPKIGIGSLRDIGAVAGRTAFSITAENCAAKVKAAQFIFSGTPDATNTQMFGNTGTATGIALRMSSAQDDAAIPPSGPPESRSRLAPVEGAPGSATATLPMFVEYVRTSAPFTPGTIRGQATLVMDYQ